MSAGVKLTVENHLDWFNHELNHCIRFEKVNETVARTLDRKLHVVDGSGCWSYLGAIPQRVLKFGIKKSFITANALKPESVVIKTLFFLSKAKVWLDRTNTPTDRYL